MIVLSYLFTVYEHLLLLSKKVSTKIKPASRSSSSIHSYEYSLIRIGKELESYNNHHTVLENEIFIINYN